MDSGRRILAVAAVAVLTVGLAACGGGSSNAAKASSVTIATGVLPTVADPDPASAEDGQSAGYLSRQMSGTLFSYTSMPENPDTATTQVPIGPELATGATTSPDGLTWTVALRQGVKSQWGNTFTSADVAWTIKRALDRKKTAATNLSLINLDTKNPLTVVDDHTVAFHLTKPSHLFEDVMGIPSLVMFDSKAVTEKAGPGDPFGYEWIKKNSATFGPYQVGTAELPGRITMTANPNYWRGPAAISTVTFIMMSDASTRLQAVLTGQVDYAPSIEAKNIDQIKASANAQPYIQTAAGFGMYALFVLDNPEVGDVNLRRAISLAIDRTSVISTALSGVGTPATGCIPSVLGPPKTADDVQPTAQVDAAKALVAKVTGPKKVTIGFSSIYPAGSVIPELIKSNLAAIGVEATLKPYSSYSTFSADEAAGKFGIGMMAFSPYVRDASYMFHNLLVTGSPYNAGAFSDPAFDAATDKAWSGVDEATRQQGLAAACDIVTKQVPWAMLGQATGFTAINKRVTPYSATTVIAYNLKVS